MVRWLLVWLRNRIAAAVAFAIVAVGAGSVAIVGYELLGETIGLLVGGIASGIFVIFVATHPWIKDVAERMAAEERSLDPRRPF